MNREELTLSQADASWALSELADAFSHELRVTGALGAADDLGTAGLLMRLVTEPMPAPVRSSFLFLGWQEWSRDVAAPIRVEVARRADAEAAQILELADLAALDPTARPIWCDYAARLRRLVTERREIEGPLMTYWLFEHARRTQRLLGVPPLRAAAASRALRTALGSGLSGATAPLALAASAVVRA
ncbi:hypothetical protein [Micromonospora sp. WMMD980]|uniref:hypothetical protein n=1 Tax=Micromonospora sp. WMMD980 TaxID=3016088 RepID=UPI0024178796|nr:hypothetical protein [Micromonospora sp. WMMD980]MDG4800211.1 hypothetical protein [Micromonospora sp. WMMD980]